MHSRFIAAVISIATLAGCATPEPPPPVMAVPAPPPAPPAPAAEPRRDTLKHLAHRDLKPLPVRPLNAKASCSFRDETGYRGRLRLDVKEADVKRFTARVEVPRRGSCNFDLKDFRQTGSLPAVVLAAPKTGCKVSLWEQGEQVTVAFRDCRAECSGDSADYLWPILVDNRKGSCS
ncbi:MAG: hypothetical protein AB1642_01125 [Pseudomonadota bacterium]